MTLKGTDSFKSGVQELSIAINKKPVDWNIVNVLLDQINAVDFQNSLFNDHTLVDLIIISCTKIPPVNSLLVGKSCNLILNHVLKNKVTLAREHVTSVVYWTKEAVHVPSDLAFLDILQMTYVLIKNNPQHFSDHGTSGVSFLLENLESKANVLQPDDIKLWRVLCLHSLSKTQPREERICEVNELFNILFTQSTDNLLTHAKIWRTVIEALDGLAAKGKWLNNKLNEVIGIIEVATTLGLNGKHPLPPKQIFPSSFFTPEPLASDTPTKNNRDKQAAKKKQKSKAKRLNWIDRDEESSENRATRGFEVYNTSNFTSDSDFSDTESGQASHIAKEQAKTRHAAFNFIIRLSNVLKGNQLYGYYNVLLNALIQCLRYETSNRTRVGALAAVSALLMHSKPLLAQAHHDEGSSSFQGFMGSLSELVSGLHSCLRSCLCSAPPSTVLTPLLHTVATLISASPYHRLRPKLLANLFSATLPYFNHKDPAVRVGVLKCLNEIAFLNPSTSEQKDILQKGMKLADSSSGAWVVSFVIPLLEVEETNVPVRTTCWQIVGNLFKNHFELIEKNLAEIEDLLFADLKSSNNETQLYATYSLNKLLEAAVSKDPEDLTNKDRWLKLLKGPFVSLLQSPEVIACEACDCLANMGPVVFNSLKEEEQIVVVTLIFGCINHEKSNVRAAAVHTLGIFLLFPQMTNEQFLYDTKDLLVRSLSDTFLLVRIKAAWAIANLVDLIINNQNEESFSDIDLRGILKASIGLVKDDDAVKSNILRAIGLLLSVLKEDFSDPEVDQLLDKSVQFLLKCASSGSKMKMRWNACHAITTMLKNKDLLLYSDKWMVGLLQTLCNLIVACSNFKVRANACTALCQISARHFFGILYPFIWTSLLDGLDNAVNMPDFREYKHQDSLKQHLCSAVCHMTTMITPEDLGELECIMAYRLENLQEHITYFQTNTLPELTATAVSAANAIQTLIQSPATIAHREFLFSLKEIFCIV